MKCEECQALLEEYLDGELDQIVTGAVSFHVENCLPCSTTLQELTLECQAYQSYERRLDVSPDLWARVRLEITEESRPRPPALFERWQPGLGKAFSRRFSVPVAVALVFLAIVSTVAVMKYLDKKEAVKQIASSVGNPQVTQNQVADPKAKGSEVVGLDSDSAVAREPLITLKGSELKKNIEARRPTENARSRVSSAKPDPLESRTPAQLVRDAEKKYLSAIVLLTRDAQQRPSQLDSETRAKLDGALAAIDRTIFATRRAVQRNPNDPLAVQYMLSAYGKKVEVLKEMTAY
jgi:putative zinc finger protein